MKSLQDLASQEKKEDNFLEEPQEEEFLDSRFGLTRPEVFRREQED